MSLAQSLWLKAEHARPLPGRCGTKLPNRVGFPSPGLRLHKLWEEIPENP